jgi:hypothetical protein
VDYNPSPDCVGPQRKKPKNYPSNYRTQSFQKRLVEVDHAIGDYHCKYCHIAKFPFQGVDEKAPEKEFQSEKLKAIQRFPEDKIQQTTRVMVEWVCFLKLWGKRYKGDCYCDRYVKKHIDFEMFYKPARRKTIVP